MPLPDINPILRAAESTQQKIDLGANSIIELAKQKSSAASNDASLQADIGINNALIETAKNTAALATQNARLKAGEILRTNLNSQGEEISSLVAQQTQAYNERMQALQAIQEKSSVSFMTNPLQYIMNQFTLNDDIQKHNAAVDIENAVGERINYLNTQTNAVANTQSLFTQTITQAGIDASAKNLKNTAELLANKARIESIGYNIEGVKEAINASKESLNVRFNVQNAQNQQEQLRIQLANYDLHLKELGIRQQELGIRQQELGMRKREMAWKEEERQLGREADAIFVENMQKGFEVLYGKNAPDLTNPKLARQYLALLKSNTPAGAEANQALMTGRAGVIAGTPATMISILQTAQGASINWAPEQVPIKKFLDSTVAQVATIISKDPTKAPKNKQEEADLVNQVVSKRLNDMLKNIDPGDKNNLFNIVTPLELIKLPGISSEPLVAKVLAPAAQSGFNLANNNMVYAAAFDAVKKKTITIEEAVAGLNFMYQKGVEVNLKAKNFPKFGIVANDNMRSYKTEIDTISGAIFGGTDVVDLTNYNDTKRAMLKSLTVYNMPARLVGF